MISARWFASVWLLKSATNTLGKINEREALQSLLEDANGILKHVKDTAAAKAALGLTTGIVDAEDKFNELLEAVKAARPSQVSNSVFKHIRFDFFLPFACD